MTAPHPERGRPRPPPSLQAAIAAALGIAAALATPAAAGPCDALTEPLAYNACLARQGPAARAVHVGPVAPRSGARARRVVVAPRRGRSELVFSPGG